MVGKMLSHYQLVEKIGEGGMGVVWKADDTILGRTVAIKVLTPDAARDETRRRMFLDEAKLASTLGHANIAQVYELGCEGELDFIVMEYIEGKALNQVMHGRPMQADRVANLGLQVALAVSRAHRKGLVHRDLKPANIMVTPDGDAKVVDFGLATLLEQRDTTLLTGILPGTETLSGLADSPARGGQDRPAIAGTVPYMSPEQVRGERLDGRSDVFSLGAVLYEMTTGERPFKGRTSPDVVHEILKAQPPAPHEIAPAIPLDLERIIQKAMSLRPADRYQTMDDLAVDLKRLGRELDSGSSPSFQDLVHTSRRSTWRLWTWLGVGALLVLAALFGWLAAGDRMTEHKKRNIPSLMIFPLQVRGRTDGADFAGQAMAEAIAVNLTQVQGIRVLPVPDPKELPAEGGERGDIARRAGAERLIVGSLSRNGNATFVTVSLIDIADNKLTWGTQQEVQPDDLQGLASQLARDIAVQLGAAPSRLYGTSAEYSSNPLLLASPAWIEAIGAMSSGNLEAANKACSRVVVEFPNDVEGWVLRAEITLTVNSGTHSIESGHLVMEAIEAIERRDPGHPRIEHLRTRHAVIWEEVDRRDVLAAYDRLLGRMDLTAGLRSDILATRAFVALADRENQQEALANLEEALRLTPANWRVFVGLSRLCARQGQHGKALLRARQSVALSPGNHLANSALGNALFKLRRYSESIAPYRVAFEKHPTGDGAGSLGAALFLSGQQQAGLQLIEEQRSLVRNANDVYNLACSYALIGQRDRALQELRRAVQMGWWNEWMAEDSDLQSLHGDQEFESVLSEMRRHLTEKH